MHVLNHKTPNSMLHMFMPKMHDMNGKKEPFLQKKTNFSQLWACVKFFFSIKSLSVFGALLWEKSQTCPYILIGETWDIIEKLKLNVLLKLFSSRFFFFSLYQ
ncbi:unnamed protein product, partial [Meganyctiphanes norvegica]